jgi:hypothetical protein
MIIKTKKFQFDKNQYIKFAMLNIAREWWWAWLVPAAVLLIPVFYKDTLGWSIFIALLLIVLYLLFWFIQFTAVTQLEQSKLLFERLRYEIDSRAIKVMKTDKEGFIIEWNKIQRVEKKKDGFLFVLSKAQFLYFPFDVFQGEQSVKLLETILKRKNLLAGYKKSEETAVV